MILILGGLSSGKRTYVRNILGYAERALSREISDACPVVYDVQDLVSRDPKKSLALLEPLCKKEVVIVNEVGSGLIPMNAADRAAREATGRLTILLAERAEKVVRMVAGLPSVIKG